MRFCNTLLGEDLDSAFRKRLPQKETSKLIPKGGDGASHTSLWGKSVPGRGDSKVKGPKVERA